MLQFESDASVPETVMMGELGEAETRLYALMLYAKVAAPGAQVTFTMSWHDGVSSRTKVVTAPLTDTEAPPLELTFPVWHGLGNEMTYQLDLTGAAEYGFRLWVVCLT